MAEVNFKDAHRLSHAYIISSPLDDESDRIARGIAAAAVCSGSGNVPCGLCRDCRKVSGGIHPDVITVDRLSDDKGRQKRDITVDQVRAVISDAVVLPNEAERKVYIIRHADTMNPAAQNAALKLLEEPPKGVILLLCAANAENLLPTVRSRCVLLGGTGGTAEIDEGSAALAREYLHTVAARDAAALFAWCTSNEGMTVLQAAAFADAVNELIADMLCGRQNDMGLEKAQLLRLSALMDKCRTYLRVNTGVKHIFGLLAVDGAASAGN